jgi:hypothetical protein
MEFVHIGHKLCFLSNGIIITSWVLKLMSLGRDDNGSGGAKPEPQQN